MIEKGECLKTDLLPVSVHLLKDMVMVAFSNTTGEIFVGLLPFLILVVVDYKVLSPIEEVLGDD